MGENNYTLGLLLASCVVLLAAVVLTTVEITDYRGAQPMRAVAAPGPASAAPAIEVEAEEGAAAIEEGETPAEEAAAEGG